MARRTCSQGMAGYLRMKNEWRYRAAKDRQVYGVRGETTKRVWLTVARPAAGASLPAMASGLMRRNRRQASSYNGFESEPESVATHKTIVGAGLPAIAAHQA